MLQQQLIRDTQFRTCNLGFWTCGCLNDTSSYSRVHTDNQTMCYKEIVNSQRVGHHHRPAMHAQPEGIHNCIVYLIIALELNIRAAGRYLQFHTPFISPHGESPPHIPNGEHFSEGQAFMTFNPSTTSDHQHSVVQRMSNQWWVFDGQWVHFIIILCPRVPGSTPQQWGMPPPASSMNQPNQVHTLGPTLVSSASILSTSNFVSRGGVSGSPRSKPLPCISSCTNNSQPASRQGTIIPSCTGHHNSQWWAQLEVAPFAGLGREERRLATDCLRMRKIIACKTSHRTLSAFHVHSYIAS